MAIMTLNAEMRTETGTRASRALREAGFIPVNLYSHGQESSLLKVEYTPWAKALGGEIHLINVMVKDGSEHMAAIREIQRNPLTQEIIHIDLLGVRLDEVSEFSVRVEFIGSPVGVKDGGVLSKATDHIDVECLPTIVPDVIQIDVSGLQIGDALNAADLVMPDGVTLLSDPHITLASVMTIRVVEEEKPVVPEGEEVAEGEAREGEEESAKPTGDDDKEKGRDKEKSKGKVKGKGKD